jgi:hypothetical protein
VLAALPSKFKLTLKVNGKAFGQVAIDKASLVADLSPEQVNALLLSLPRHANIEFAGKLDTWVVSDAGAAAVLLKMDEYQGRVGTAGAIVRKGSLPEASVPAAAPAPTITRAAMPRRDRATSASSSQTRKRSWMSCARRSRTSIAMS